MRMTIESESFSRLKNVLIYSKKIYRTKQRGEQMYNFRKKKRIEGEYGSVITSQNEKIFHGEHGIVNLVKEPTGTKYTRITKDDVRLEISFLQKDECDTIQLVPKIVDIDGREWDCCIIIIKSENFIKCSARLESVCNTDYTDISIEDYHMLLYKPLIQINHFV